MMPNLNFQRDGVGGGGLRTIHFHGEGIDILWNYAYTIYMHH